MPTHNPIRCKPVPAGANIPVVRAVIDLSQNLPFVQLPWETP